MAVRDVVNTDVLIVGGGPAGLAAAIHLADLISDHHQKIASGERIGDPHPLPFSILLIEKGGSIGSHSISGAVVNPSAFQELLPGTPLGDIPFDSSVTADEAWFLTRSHAFKLPFHPPYMANKGNYLASLGKLSRWLAGVAEKKGVQVFPGFAGRELLMDQGRVLGVCTGDSGLDKHGNKQSNYQPGTEVRAKITILAEGSRGFLAKKLIQNLELAKDSNPQIYSTGVKELWEVPAGTFKQGRVVHTLGYPLDFFQFGGGFIYGMANNQVAVGLVVGLDYRDPTFDLHHAFQVYKRHPFIQAILQNGRILRYGAKTIPEGGWFALPKLYHHGVMIVGDSAGFLSMPSLKGIHLGIQSGMLAAKAAYQALIQNDFSEKQLSVYSELFKKSLIAKDLYRVRNFRQGFKSNLMFGAIHFGAQLATGGHGLTLTGRLTTHEDYECLDKLSKVKGRGFLEKFKNEIIFDKRLTWDKVTDVFYSGTQHDEHQPSHCLIPDPNVCRDVCIPEYGAPCQHFCPAEVYELVTDPKTARKDVRIHFTNCVHCKTCDIKDPFRNIQWVPPYGGDGPAYENL
ncbi:MAG: electron transfer flavoprotein-ubiquinone oxidoreductase [Candidatus Omnitrophica bacterium]|nr:electron transfer flavoprotein-ubiquinone oxidoreductase [Candidatus Omnitrophota bacterium]